MLADFNRKSNILCSYYIYLQYFNLYHLHVSGNQRNKISNSLSFLCCIVLCLNCCTMYHLMHCYFIYFISYYLCFYCDFLWDISHFSCLCETPYILSWQYSMTIYLHQAIPKVSTIQH